MANKSLQQLIADFKASRQAMEKLNNDIPRIMGKESVTVVKENFKLQGYDSGNGVRDWDKRKPATDKAYDKGRVKGKNGKLSKYRKGDSKNLKGSVYNSENPLLMQTRNLFNSVKYQQSGGKVEIGVDLGLIPYAQKMNEERQFMPIYNPNVKMLKGIQDKIVKERDKAMKEFKK